MARQTSILGLVEAYYSKARTSAIPGLGLGPF